MRKVLEVPLNERIPALLEHPENYEPIYTALVASLKSALTNIHVRVGMGDDQVLELAQMILDSAKEDNLGLEDVLLFLGELLHGKAGKIYDRLDIPTFFELFEYYRQRRHEMMKDFREEQSAQFKALPVDIRFVHENTEAEKTAIRRAATEYFINTSKPISDGMDGAKTEQP
ncbi:MAG TPA: hypothetical protein VKU83_11545 [Puia sp.]|nr:hypothetical protein [Puia sp.]